MTAQFHLANAKKKRRTSLSRSTLQINGNIEQNRLALALFLFNGRLKVIQNMFAIGAGSKNKTVSELSRRPKK